MHLTQIKSSISSYIYSLKQSFTDHNINPKNIFEKSSPKHSDISKNKDVYDITTEVYLEQLKSHNAKIKMKKVMPFGEAEAFLRSTPGILSHILPEHQVWVIQIYYPNGYSTQSGFIKNALVTKIYNAKTGAFYGESIKIVSESQG